MQLTFGQICEEKRRMIPRPHILRKLIADMLADYPSTRSKKIMMSKEINEQVYFIQALEGSFKRHGESLAWHLGIQYNRHDYKNACENLNILLEIKKAL